VLPRFFTFGAALTPGLRQRERNRETGGHVVDAAYLALTVFFFALSLALVELCDRL
jgi:hypothetical protein